MMWSRGRHETKSRPEALYDKEEFSELLPYLETLYGVALRFTGDARDAVALAEKALVGAVVRMHASDKPAPPKMALLGALREVYMQSLETANSSTANA